MNTSVLWQNPILVTSAVWKNENPVILRARFSCNTPHGSCIEMAFGNSTCHMEIQHANWHVRHTQPFHRALQMSGQQRPRATSPQHPDILLVSLTGTWHLFTYAKCCCWIRLLYELTLFILYPSSNWGKPESLPSPKLYIPQSPDVGWLPLLCYWHQFLKLFSQSVTEHTRDSCIQPRVRGLIFSHWSSGPSLQLQLPKRVAPFLHIAKQIIF